MTAPVPQSQPNSSDDLLERLASWDHGCGKTMIVSEAIDRIAALTARCEALTYQLDTCRLSAHNAEVEIDRLNASCEAMEKALRIAEDVLSRAPFSTAIWPNGMHPNTGIQIIRAALLDLARSPGMTK